MSKASARILLLVAALAFWASICEPAIAGSRLTYNASDGQTVYATLSQPSSSTPRHAIALLFHQAGANRHEYDPIVPRLTRLGFDTLAVDQRSGGTMFGHGNKTVAERGRSASYQAAYADLAGALDWARRHHYQTIVAVGSSYSASLVLELAANAGDRLAAAAAFSPGEYFDNPNRVKNAVAHIKRSLYITTDPAEEKHVEEVLSRRTDGSMITRYKPAHGVHGASTLVAARDPAGYRANWRNFRAFMLRFAPETNNQ